MPVILATQEAESMHLLSFTISASSSHLLPIFAKRFSYTDYDSE
jgi:hypothetical protein